MYKRYTKSEYDTNTKGMNVQAKKAWMRDLRQDESDALNVARDDEIESASLSGQRIASAIYDNRKDIAGHKGRDSKSMAKACKDMGIPFNGNSDGTPSTDAQFNGQSEPSKSDSGMTTAEQASASQGDTPMTEAEAKLQAMQDLLGGGKVDEDEVRKIASDEAGKVADDKLKDAIKPIEITNDFDGEVKTIEGTHERFQECLRSVRVHGRLLMHGDKGTGKSQIVKGIAEALGKEYRIISCNAETSEVELFGYITPNDGVFHQGVVLEAYEGGMLLFFDEFDALDPNVGVALNAWIEAKTDVCGVAIRTGNPVAIRGEGFIPIGACNSLTGATEAYQGRNKPDEAVLSRFPNLTRIKVDYCKKLETRILADAPELADRLWELRRTVNEQMMNSSCIPTTRDFHAMALEVAYRDSECAKTNKDGKTDANLMRDFVANWSDEEIAKVNI